MKVLRVKELVTLLRTLLKQGTIHANFEVWLSSDEEGNSFSPLLDNPEVSMGVERNKLIFYPAHETSDLFGDSSNKREASP